MHIIRFPSGNQCTYYEVPKVTVYRVGMLLPIQDLTTSMTEWSYWIHSPTTAVPVALPWWNYFARLSKFFWQVVRNSECVLVTCDSYLNVHVTSNWVKVRFWHPEKIVRPQQCHQSDSAERGPLKRNVGHRVHAHNTSRTIMEHKIRPNRKEYVSCSESLSSAVLGLSSRRTRISEKSVI